VGFAVLEGVRVSVNEGIGDLLNVAVNVSEGKFVGKSISVNVGDAIDETLEHPTKAIRMRGINKSSFDME